MSPERLEKLLSRRVELWVVALIVLLGGAVWIMTAWAVWYRATGGEGADSFTAVAEKIATVPAPLMEALLSDKGLDEVVQPQLVDFTDFQGLRRYRENFVDRGTLLLSAFSRAEGVSTILLYDLASQRVLHEWVPPVEELLAVTEHRNRQSERHNFRSQHPLLLPGGEVLITSGEGPLLLMDACGELLWSVDRHFHHSIEQGHDGSLYVPVVSRPLDVPYPLRNDGIARVSTEGKLLREWSIYEILLRHGFGDLLRGWGIAEEDRLHLNDIDPIESSDAWVRRGDLMLSVRNLSLVFVYRPSEDRILWSQTGPWLNQHDVDYLGDGVFTVFGNDMIRGEKVNYSHRGYNTIWQYDQKTGETTALLALDEPVIDTRTEGRHRVLPDGDIIVEETNRGLVHRVDKAGVLWSYNRGLGSGKIGALHWSRYLTAGESRFPWLDGLSCEKSGA